MPRKPPATGMPIRLEVGFTEAEAQALGDLSRLLAGGGVRQPLITALNKVRAQLVLARKAHAASPTGRARNEAEARETIASGKNGRAEPRIQGLTRTRRAPAILPRGLDDPS